MTDTKVSLTAKICSFSRAYHSNFCKDKIFDDYLAYDMMGKEEYEQIGSLIYNNFDISKVEGNCSFKSLTVQEVITEYFSPITLSRICFAEKKLQAFAKKHGECQYVICGAGVDTFAFRNENPNIQIFEIDHPVTQRYKLERIHALEWNIPKNVHYVPVDFEKENMKRALIKSGFDQNKKTFFSILGVTYYLTLPVFEETIKNIAELSTDENVLLFDYPDETTFVGRNRIERVRRLTEITASLGEIMKQGFSYESLKAALYKHRFDIEEHMPPKKIQSAFFEGRNDNHHAFENVHFISAIYRKEVKE